MLPVDGQPNPDSGLSLHRFPCIGPECFRDAIRHICVDLRAGRTSVKMCTGLLPLDPIPVTASKCVLDSIGVGKGQFWQGKGRMGEEY